MIPNFPRLKKLAFHDKDKYESLIHLFPCYSDFDFTSLWCWDSDREVKISMLNKNLVVKFKDYLTNDFFFSFIGLNKVEETAKTLLEQAKDEKIEETLFLIPEEIVERIQDKMQFAISEDRDNFDYIYKASELIILKGRDNKSERYLVNLFQRRYSKKYSISLMDVTSKNVKERLTNLFYRWEVYRKKSRKDTSNELKAFKKILRHHAKFQLMVIGLFIGKKLIAFNLCKLTHDGYGMIYFEKADSTYAGAYQYLRQQLAVVLQEKGIEKINYQQDLGIAGLRRAKLSHAGIRFLKKYKVKFA